MKIYFFSTEDSNGGAFAACKRVIEAIKQTETHDLNLIVKYKKTNLDFSHSIFSNKLKKYYSIFSFYLEKIILFLKYKHSEGLFNFSQNLTGTKFKNYDNLSKADIFNIHWINHSFISFDGLLNLIKLNKPTFVTLHDMWFFTGGCHYSESCQSYKSNCGFCPILNSKDFDDAASVQFDLKQNIYKYDNIYFVTPSKWLFDLAKESALLKGKEISLIPYPVDTNFYKPQINKSTNKIKILFIATNLNDPRKGFSYFITALELLASKSFDIDNIEFHIIGQIKKQIHIGKLNIFYHGLIIDKIKLNSIMAACDIYVITSLQDNLPNTVIESLSCGLVCIGFNSGGIPEMIINNENGFVIDILDAEAICDKILYLVKNDEIRKKMSVIARETALSNYSQTAVANAYLNLFNSKLGTE